MSITVKQSLQRGRLLFEDSVQTVDTLALSADNVDNDQG